MAQMGEDFRNRLRSAEAEGKLGFVEDDREVDDVDPEFDELDPANDPSQEYTFVRDQAL